MGPSPFVFFGIMALAAGGIAGAFLAGRAMWRLQYRDRCEEPGCREQALITEWGADAVYRYGTNLCAAHWLAAEGWTDRSDR